SPPFQNHDEYTCLRVKSKSFRRLRPTPLSRPLTHSPTFPALTPPPPNPCPSYSTKSARNYCTSLSPVGPGTLPAIAAAASCGTRRKHHAARPPPHSPLCF